MNWLKRWLFAEEYGKIEQLIFEAKHANELIQAVKADLFKIESNVQLVEVKTFDNSNIEYIKALAEISASQEFKCFTTQHREEIIDVIDTRKADNEQRELGKLEGLKQIRKLLAQYAQRYEAIMNEAAEEKEPEKDAGA